MPNYVSKDGVWYPGKERVALKNRSGKAGQVPGTKETVQPGDDFIYEGPDRGAMEELAKSGEKNFGVDFRKDPELINRVKQLGYESVEEFALANGYDAKKVEEEFKKKASEVNTHEIKNRVKMIKKLGGGADFANMGQERYGGFGMHPKD